MLDARYVADHLDEVRTQLARRGPEFAQALDGVALLSSTRRELVRKTETLQAERNTASDAMAKLAKSGDKEGMAARRDELKALSERVKGLESELAELEAQIEEKLLHIPNVPHPSVPDGTSEEQNKIVRTWGDKPSFDFEPKAHWELGEKLGILDFERAAKLSGARFSVLYGQGARLERALAAFMLDLHTLEHGYTGGCTPYLVKAEALRGTGNLPKFEEDLFKTKRSDPNDPSALYLIPTAEVPVTNLHADEILEASELPPRVHRLHALFSQRSGFVWSRHAWAHSAASVRQSRARAVCRAGASLGATRSAHAPRGRGAETAEFALSRRRALRGRSQLSGNQRL